MILVAANVSHPVGETPIHCRAIGSRFHPGWKAISFVRAPLRRNAGNVPRAQLQGADEGPVYVHVSYGMLCMCISVRSVADS